MNTFRLPLLSRARGLACVFVGRGPAPRPDPASLVPLLGAPENRLPPVAVLRQVHSNRCLLVRGDGRPALEGGRCTLVGEGDAMVTSARGVALGIATADCLPIVAVDPEAPALAVVHAGWRGTVAGVLSRALDLMREELGARPDRTLVGSGPGIGACCYRVGPEVIEAFGREHPAHAQRAVSEPAAGAHHLDLLEANRMQAIDAGVDPARFASVGVCTVCRADLCHSYRREGDSAGRMWLLAALLS